MVSIFKQTNGFGFTLADHIQGQHVKAISDPVRCGRLRVGDVIVEINDQRVKDIPHVEVVQILKQCPVGKEARLLVQRGDDLALLSHTQQQMQKTTSVAAVSVALGLNIHKGKIKILRYNAACTNRITLDGEALKNLKTFTFLDSIIGKHSGSDADVKACIGKARAAYLQLKNIWNSKQPSTNAKVRIFNTNVDTVLVYWTETWRTTKFTIQKIKVFINSCLRKMLRIRWVGTISKNLLWKRTNQIPVEQEVRKKRWKWVGHTLRKAPNCVMMQALTWSSQSQRRSGIPKNTLRREIETDMRRMNKNWIKLERKAQDRVGWKVLIGSLCSIESNCHKLFKVNYYDTVICSVLNNTPKGITIINDLELTNVINFIFDLWYYCFKEITIPQLHNVAMFV
ncbi:unnamed protein product [Schistosoma margrebowiei]|uniref:Uncharacterized protein n=1 Tax=Schistosoma margrebowiei TaxID=48269 RepID=A0A183M5E7_9TREM|nr:unnamed protein product [Schistosoma margrebowiei]